MESAESFPVKARARRILIVDDHPVFRRGVSDLIEIEQDLVICSEAENSAQAISAIRTTQPDAAVVDISMPGINGIELIKMIRAETPTLPILVLSMHKEGIYASRALKAGAKGYIMKSDAAFHIVEGLRRILDHRIYLTPEFSEQVLLRAIHEKDIVPHSPVDALTSREKQVLELMGRGLTTREIAEKLQMSGKTVEAHRGHMRRKLYFKDGGELMRFAQSWAVQDASTTSERS